MKDKKILIIAAASAVIVIALLVIFLPSGKKSDEGPEVISMRAKVESPAPVEPVPAETAPGAPATDAAQPGTAPAPEAPGAAAPAPMGAAPVHAPPAATVKKAEPAPVLQPKASEPPVQPAVTKVEAPKAEEPVKKAEVKKERKPQAMKAKTDIASKPWAINVASFVSLPEAQSLAGALKKAGYNSYITPFSKDDVQWQRVRVGFFTTREEAGNAGKAIQSKFRVESPWIVKPETRERRAH